MRYIDADKLQEVFKELHGGKRSLLIDTEPTADVRENVKGEWKWVSFFKNGSYGNFGCSVCGYRNGTRYNFCPNCGADMRTD